MNRLTGGSTGPGPGAISRREETACQTAARPPRGWSTPGRSGTTGTTGHGHGPPVAGRRRTRAGHCLPRAWIMAVARSHSIPPLRRTATREPRPPANPGINSERVGPSPTNSASDLVPGKSGPFGSRSMTSARPSAAAARPTGAATDNTWSSSVRRPMTVALLRPISGTYGHGEPHPTPCQTNAPVSLLRASVQFVFRKVMQ
jgi:hypothetical protein